MSDIRKKFEKDLKDGERYVGIILGENGEKSYRIIRMSPSLMKDLTWQQALDYAKSIGGEAPNLRELGLLRVNDRDFFGIAIVWSREQLTPGSYMSWCQDFSSGTQGYYTKYQELSAVAIRKEELHSV